MSERSAAIPKDILQELHKELMGDSLKLPVFPDVALRVREACGQVDCSLENLSKIIQYDTGLSVYILRVANSSMYRGVDKVDSLRKALTRIGLSATRNLAVSYAMRAMYENRSEVVKTYLAKQWERSVSVAANAFVIAKLFSFCEPDKAMLAGILQDVGCLPIIDRLEKYPQVFQHDNAVNQYFQRFAAELGVEIVRHWKFDEEMQEVVQRRNDWAGEIESTTGLSDLVLVARYHSQIGTSQKKSLPPIKSIKAFGKLGIDVSDESNSLKIVQQAREEIKAARQLLGAAV